MPLLVCVAAKLSKSLRAGAVNEIVNSLPGCDVLWLENMSASDRAKALKKADIVLCGMITHELSAEEKGLLGHAKFVQTMSAGVNQIDFSLLPKDINLHSNAGGWSHAIAEHALAMTLSCNRRLRLQTEELASGVFYRQLRPLKLLDGATVLIFGWGGIGRAAGRLYKAFGSRLIAVGRTAPEHEMLDAGYPFERCDEAFPLADVILLSCPSNNTTRGIINAHTLSLMKEDAVLVNIARGDLVDRAAIEEHVKTHSEFCLAMDTWWEERSHYPEGGYDILKLPNVIGTPHSSYLSSTAFMEAARMAVANIQRFISGQPTTGKVNINEYRQ